MKKFLVAGVSLIALQAAVAAPNMTPQWGWDSTQTLPTGQPLQYKIGTTWTAIPLMAQINTWTVNQIFTTTRLGSAPTIPTGFTSPLATWESAYPGNTASADPFRFDTGGFPINNEFFGNPTVTPAGWHGIQSLVGTIKSPLGATTSCGGAPCQDVAVAGYAQSLEASRAAVAIFGEGGIGVDGGYPFGANFVAVNCKNHDSSCVPGSAYNVIQGKGIEVDVVAFNTSSGTPTGTFYGYEAVLNRGGGTGQTTSIAFAVDPLGSATSNWQTGFQCSSGGSVNCLTVGATAATGTSKNSQPISFVSLNSSGTPLTNSLFQNSVGDFQFNNVVGSNTVLLAQAYPQIQLIGGANTTVGQKISTSATTGATANFILQTGTANNYLSQSLTDTGNYLFTAGSHISQTVFQMGSGPTNVFTLTPTTATIAVPLYVGAASATTGTVSLANASSANLTSIQAGNASAAVTYTLPTAAPAGANYALISDTTGTMSWASPATLINLTPGVTPTAGGAAGQLMYDTGSVLQESANLVFASNALTIGKASTATGALTLANSGSAFTASIQSGANTPASWTLTLPLAVPAANGAILTATTAGVSSWTSILPLANGGTNANLTASNGGIVYSTASAFAVLSGTATANQHLASGASGAPSWTTATFPATTAAGTILASGTANAVTASATPTLGVNATTTGTLGFANGGATGATVTVQNNGATTAYNFNLPTTVGTAGYLLTSQAGGTSAMTWTSPTTTVNGQSCTLGSSCTVTAVASSIPFPATVSGTVTSGGIPYFSSTTGMASSALLAQYQLVVGGGAGAAPATLGATGSAGQHLQSGGAAANPSWTTATFPATTTAGTILASGTANTVTATATPTLGVQSTTAGTLTLANTNAGAFPTTLASSASSTAAWTLTLPVATPAANGAVLTSTTGGVSSWTSTLPIANGGTGLTALGTNVQSGLGSAVNSAGGFLYEDGASNVTATISTFTASNTGSYTPQFVMFNQAADSSGPYFIARKGRAASGAGSAVQVGDYLGSYLFAGNDSAGNSQNAAYINSTVTGVAAGSVTASFNFVTVGAAPIIFTTSNTSERMRIDGASGGVTIGSYLRAGSASAPVNTTAGDITGGRLSIGNGDLAAAGGLMRVEGNIGSVTAGSYGMYYAPTLTNSVNLTNTMYGILAYPATNMTGGAGNNTVTQFAAVAAGFQNPTAGTITNAYGFWASSLLNQAGITNSYGFRCDMTAGNCFYNSNTAASNVFAGKTRIGSTTAAVNTLDIAGTLGRGAPNTPTISANAYTVAATDSWLIINNAASTTLTLPTASSFTGRELMIKNITAQTVVSASSNVVPLAGGAAGTAILAATAGKFATLVSDGTNWIIMQAN